jgi:prepilin-type N-terminal cleavage/methylation domain-containing protein
MRSTRTVPKGARESPTGNASFTLIELVLVVAVIGIVAAVTMPAFVRSIRGNRLRMAARTVIMAGRYARNMAILNQREMLVELSPESSRVAVRSVRVPEPGAGGEFPASDLGPDDEPHWLAEKNRDEQADEDEDDTPVGVDRAEIVRVLDGARIVEIEIRNEAGEDDEQPAGGTRRVLYASNGLCTPYSVTIADDRGETIVVKVDRLGSVETERL